MNRDQSYALIRQTFTQGFEKARFRNFAVNLLNRIDETKAQAWNTTYVKNAFKNHVACYERLGTYTSPDKEKLDVLVVHLTQDTKLERARTAIRDFVADHLKNRDEKDAALVAFVSPSETSWRFSYIKMEYATVEKDSGKVDTVTRLTPARRFSYIVGAGESCHTAQTRFLDLLQDIKTDPSLAALEEAFSVEAVTKEFFTKYAELFEEIRVALDKMAAQDKTLRDEFTDKGVNTVDFAKKLMGQIVFLYFLQKKGWLGVKQGQPWGSGPHDFLRRLANGQYGAYANFFNDLLEPLFYDTLATERGADAMSKLFNCRIPFLNGGLFEPLGDYDWSKTDIILPNKLFTNSEYVEEGITGTGVLDVFDRYNFTVNEAEPLEKEVAIDPEMLGKVFENLIEDNRRKSLGAIYTPREIVHYMCQESLINYLDTALNADKQRVPRADMETFIYLGEQISHYEAVDTKYRGREMPSSIKKHAQQIDDALADIAVCDPAVGSGAFPVGMMTEIVRARSALNPYLGDAANRTRYHFKRHAIQHCLYGVDIDAGAVEIAKLRLWLSLVVDEEDVEHINPLPNLDYKIVTGNSLLGVEKNLFNNELFIQLEKFKPQYFDETDAKKKAALKQKIDNLINQLTNGKKIFDFEIYFSEVFHRRGGFDVMLANPPYVGEKGHKEIFDQVHRGVLKRFYQGQMDLFYFFIHLALNLGRQNASIAFITTNYYPTATGARNLRRDLKERATIKHLINFGELKIFESALGQHNMITVLSKSHNEVDIANNCYTKRKAVATSAVLQCVLSGTDEVTEYYQIPQGELYDGDECYIRLTGNSTATTGDPAQSSINKIKQQGTLLSALCNVNVGLYTGADKVSNNYIEKYSLKMEKNEGIFIITREEMKALHLNSFERSKICPFYKNSDVYRWHTKEVPDLFLINISYPENRDIDFKAIPNIFRHISKYEKILRNRKSNDNGLRAVIAAGYWWSFTIRQIDFSKPKIVVPQRSTRNTFGYNEVPWYASADVYFITLKEQSISLKYVLSLLSSKLYYLWLYHRGKRKGETLELYQQPLSEIPIKRLDKSQQKPFVDLVDRILAAKQRNPDADVSALEREIDRLVYRLYDLTPDEIAIVEGKSS
jgi:type I restriction-modification system DNA methylase subunit